MWLELKNIKLFWQKPKNSEPIPEFGFIWRREMNYSQFAFLWPPRPEKAIPHSFIGFYSKKGWVAQYKKNGTCTVLFVSPEKEIITKTRHNEDHKRWSPSVKSNAPFKTLPGNGWYVFVSELMDSKTSEDIKDTHYINDILVADGRNLEGTTFEERQEILKSLFLVGGEEETESHWIVTPNFWLAKTITEKFKSTWTAINDVAQNMNGAPTDEGLVFKNPKAPLVMCSKSGSNSGWQVKCRVQHKNYTF